LYKKRKTTDKKWNENQSLDTKKEKRDTKQSSKKLIIRIKKKKRENRTGNIKRKTKK
jgi:hypothetical protein